MSSSMNTSFEEPTIPLPLRRPLAAMWISLGLHVAVIALVQVAPAVTTRTDGPVIEARLVSPHTVRPAEDTPSAALEANPLLAPSETAEALPVLEPVAPPLAAPVPPANAEPVPATLSPEPIEAPPEPTVPVAITSSVDFNYYSAREVDVHPRALHEIEPAYPLVADRQKASGTVRLQLKLEADGRVTEVAVMSSSPPGVFDDVAVEAFRDAQFSPAQKAGRPVRAVVVIEVNFDWEGRPR